MINILLFLNKVFFLSDERQLTVVENNLLKVNSLKFFVLRKESKIRHQQSNIFYTEFGAYFFSIVSE